MAFAFEMNKYAPIVAREDKPNEPGEIVGIIDSKHRVAWSVSPHREDKRTGVTAAPVPMSGYWQSLHAAISIR
ncbi:hypothetical protein [Paenibacillus silvisoli]|uniref:hypothetical protein n=1 Tax=Paenibacillus silvisoli TaxID=3110539 RepID=UPI00280639AE|nr:hypothetical protein [Paenibacillus silvisoli]